ncbi:MAG: D-glycero-beta-D-manno-heptose 1-phosphate adenylyltransferase [Streptosporangiales bacterium]|nr:D-glycero-beta-D-manno-heptose 1-phosphate adenylyltransferase [Streptosporangiales bacterium]
MRTESWVDGLGDVAVLVTGDAILDVWLRGPARRLGREAPVPVVDVAETELVPGGAGNTAANLAALGVRVRLLGIAGDDRAGADLRRALRRHGVDDGGLVTAPGWSTPVKHRIVGGGQVLARYDTGGGTPPPASARRELAAAIAAAAGDVDVVVAADYATGVLDDRAREAAAHGRPLLVDAHRLADWLPYRPDVVLPDLGEAAELLGTDPSAADPWDLLTARAPELLRRAGAGTAIVTLGRRGALVLNGSTQPTRVERAGRGDLPGIGAGDAFTAAFAAMTGTGRTPAEAAAVADTAARVAAARPGTAVCGRAELRRALRPGGGPAATAEELAAALAEARRAGRRVVFTNGCFDVLHSGHVAFLREARALGDVLVVAVNDDDSVARLKGPGRPVNPVEDRVAVLAALDSVDHVTVFGEDTPVRLIEELRPGLYVKGGDYDPRMLPETPVVQRTGGEVRILGYLPDRSTTEIIDRIRSGSGT